MNPTPLPDQETRHHLRTTRPFDSIRSPITRLTVSSLAYVAPAAAEAYATWCFLRPTGPRRRTALFGGSDRRIRTSRAPQVEMRVRDAFGVVAAEVFGESGKAVLLIHGWSGCGEDMHLIALSLAAAGYRAVIMDLPAHGASTGWTTTLPEMIRAIATVAALVGPLDAIVAHSLGAAAATLALSEGEVSARAAILLAPAVGPIAFVERFCRFIGLPNNRIDGLMKRVSARAGRDLHSLDARFAARALTIPTLVVHDPDDREVPIDQGRAIADAWQGGRLVEIAGVGHRRILHDERVVSSIIGFLDSHRSIRNIGMVPASGRSKGR